jgi:hypothetical protein
VAEGLVAVGRQQGVRPVRLVDGVGIRLDDVPRVIDAISGMTARGELVVVSLDPLVQNPAAVSIIRATTGALLVVRMGESRLSSARSTVQAIGQERILGSIVLG